MTRLSINLNKIALLRNQRDIGIPSVTEFALAVVAAGAQGLTIHPRPDERHIRKTDVYDLQKLWANGSVSEKIEFNIEGYPSEEFLNLVKEIKPAQATLVPDAADVKTSDDGWDVIKEKDFLRPIIEDLQTAGIRVSLFMNPEPEQIAAIPQVACQCIEFYTGPYAYNFADNKDAAIAPYVEAAKIAREIGVGINAGHDLNLDNLAYFKSKIDNLLEVSIGHAFTADTLYLGLEKAVKSYLQALA